MKQIATKILFAMKIDIKGKKISKVGLEIFRRRKIRIANQHIRIGRFGGINQLTKEPANTLGTIPAHNLRGNLIADQMRQSGGKAPACAGALGGGAGSLRARPGGGNKREQLRPKNSRD